MGPWTFHPLAPPATDLPGVTFHTDLHEAVRAAQAVADGKYVNVLGADVALQCLAAGLLDEVLVFVVPVLLGEGTRLYEQPGGERVHLEAVPGRPGYWYRVLR